MASGIFVGLTESDILAIRDKAVAMFKEGKTIMSYSDSGSNVSKQFVMAPKEVLAECKHALQLLDPDTYGVRTTIIRTDYQGFDGF
jgi:chloramphenicol 3-O-phosphotransferase